MVIISPTLDRRLKGSWLTPELGGLLGKREGQERKEEPHYFPLPFLNFRNFLPKGFLFPWAPISPFFFWETLTPGFREFLLLPEFGSLEGFWGSINLAGWGGSSPFILIRALPIILNKGFLSLLKVLPKLFLFRGPFKRGTQKAGWCFPLL